MDGSLEKRFQLPEYDFLLTGIPTCRNCQRTVREIDVERLPMFPCISMKNYSLVEPIVSQELEVKSSRLKDFFPVRLRLSEDSIQEKLVFT